MRANPALRPLRIRAGERWPGTLSVYAVTRVIGGAIQVPVHTACGSATDGIGGGYAGCVIGLLEECMGMLCGTF